VILPQENEKDVAEVPENLRTAMKLHFVDNMDQVSPSRWKARCRRCHPTPKPRWLPS